MQSRRHSRAATRSTQVAYHALPAWKLQDAKACFSQVVREALGHEPQRVTLHGKDAVVILSAEAYGRLAPVATQPIGDLDSDELTSAHGTADGGTLAVPPAIRELRRGLLLINQR